MKNQISAKEIKDFPNGKPWYFCCLIDFHSKIEQLTSMGYELG